MDSTPPPAHFDKARSAGYLTNHLARLFGFELHERIRPFGLAPAQFMVLLELWVEDGQMARSLAERLSVEQATMTNTLSRMERDGLITRAPHPGDRRAQRILLTDRARGLEGPATTAARAVNQAALDGLSETERDEFLRLLRTVLATMQGLQSEARIARNGREG